MLSRVSRLSIVRALTSRQFATIAANPRAAKPETPSAEPVASTSTTVRGHHIVVSISGRDEVGIVQKVSSVVAEHNANMEESKMAILGGDFAMIVYVSMEEPDAADKLASKLRSELPNFSVSVRETTAPQEADAPKNIWTISLEGPDHPGIVAALSEALAKNGCNVLEMETETTTAPFAGYELFKVSGALTVDDKQLDALSKALDKVEDKFGSTISVVQDPSN